MEPLISCRRATANDVELFKKIRLRALLESPNAFGSTYEDAVKRSDASWREQLLSTVQGSLRNTQLAFAADDCIGLAALYREPDADCGALLMMWIDANFRGSPAASLLVNRLLAWAEAAGFSTVVLDVNVTNRRAIAFYRKLGFSSIGEEMDMDPSRGLRSIRMASGTIGGQKCPGI